MLNKQIVTSVLIFIAGASIVLGVEINGVSIDFVTISNANNTADSTGYGAVGYNYQIGKYEINASQWSVAIADDSNIGNAGSWSGAQATGSATWYEAAKFANWLTSGDAYIGAYQFNGSGVLTNISRSTALGIYDTVYALPTEDEWYKAAYYNGSGYNLFANTSNSAPAIEIAANYGGTSGSYSEPWDVGTGDQELNGTFDMMGNVWEWTEGGDAAITTNSINFWGGSYRSTLSSLQAGPPFPDNPTLSHETVGLRIVAIPEPGTISLMSLSTVGLFFTRTLRRRRRMGETLLPVRRLSRCDEFCVEHVDRPAEAEQEVVDLLSVAMELFRKGCVKAWAVSKTTYKEMDEAFWNRMVISHERRIARRAARRASVRRKAMDCFDALLERIMK